MLSVGVLYESRKFSLHARAQGYNREDKRTVPKVQVGEDKRTVPKVANWEDERTVLKVCTPAQVCEPEDERTVPVSAASVCGGARGESESRVLGC